MSELMSELVLFIIGLLLIRAIQVTWQRRRRAEVEAEAEAEAEAVEVETEVEEPIDIRSYHYGYLDGVEQLLRQMGGDPRTFRTDDESVYLILTSRGAWKIVLRDGDKANRIEQVRHRPSAQEPPY